MAATKEELSIFANALNLVLRPHNYHIAPTAPLGKPAKSDRTAREFRLQLINKQQDTSASLIQSLQKTLPQAISNITMLKFNSISPNSSKFPSYSFTINNNKYDLVIARGANKGENFETQTVANLASAFKTNKNSSQYADLIQQLSYSNKEFASCEIRDVQQRKGSTKKEGVLIENLGAVIGDIVLTDTTGRKWFISLKDVNGDTFSSYSGAASLFDSKGNLQAFSEGATFLRAFGVDLNAVQAGFDERNKKSVIRYQHKIVKSDSSKLKPIFARAWGMNYFYVRRLTNGWKVFWIDRKKLDSMIDNIKIDEIRYPSAKTKSIVIYCGNTNYKYLVEIRNSSGGEYPNDIKFKTVKMK